MNQMEISQAEADTRLDRFLRRHVAGLTQAAIQKFLRTGKIRLNGEKAEASTRLAPGDVLLLPDISAPARGPKARHVMTLDPRRQRELEAMVLYRDEAVIALNKPPGLAVQGGSGIQEHLDGMLDGLRFGSENRPKLVHRLDRDTSGVLILARSAPAARFFTAAFRGRDVQKIYWAILYGVPNEHQGRIDLPLKRVECGGSSRAAPAGRRDEDAQKAITDYRLLDYAGKKFCLAELSPLTGRMHQLRAHCLALGHPILGDAAYGEVFPENFAPQLHLHARRLQLPHPEGGMLSLEAPPPPHFMAALRHLGFPCPAPAPPQRRK